MPTPVGQITARRLAQFMPSSYQHLAPASWNRVTATLGSFFAYTTRQGWTVKSPAAGLERRRLRARREDDAQRRAIPKLELTAFLNTEHPLREKTLWWLLYETAARANEILALNVEDLDLPRRRAVVIGKGGRAELVGWETKTARLLPRHIRHPSAGRFSSPTSPPRRHVNPRSPTSTPTPAAPACPTAAPRSSSQRPRAAGRSTSCATPGSPTSPSTASNCRSCSPRAATPASAASRSTPNPPSTP